MLGCYTCRRMVAHIRCSEQSVRSCCLVIACSVCVVQLVLWTHPVAEEAAASLVLQTSVLHCVQALHTKRLGVQGWSTANCSSPTPCPRIRHGALKNTIDGSTQSPLCAIRSCCPACGVNSRQRLPVDTCRFTAAGSDLQRDASDVRASRVSTQPGK